MNLKFPEAATEVFLIITVPVRRGRENTYEDEYLRIYLTKVYCSFTGNEVFYKSFITISIRTVT